MFELSFVIILLMLLSGFIKGFVGFGFSIVLIFVLLSMGVKQTELMPILVPLFVVLDILLYLEHRKKFSIEYETNFALHPTTLMTTFIGVLLGTYLLLEFDVEILKLFFAVSVLLILGLLIFKVDKHQIKVPDERQNGFFGSFAGLMTGLFTLNGIVASIYLLYHQYPKEKYMVTLVTFLLLSDIILVSVYLFAGLFTVAGFILSMQILVIVLIGFYGGVLVRKYVSARVFKMVIITVLAVNSGRVILDFILAAL